MAILFADDFVASDNTAINGRTLPVGGGTWAPLFASTAKIFSNQYQEQSIGDISGSGYGNYQDSGVADKTISLDLFFPGSGFFDAGIYFRLLNNTNFWILICEQGGSNGSLNLYEINGGSLFQRGTYNSGAAFTSTNHDISLELSGNDIIGYLDGVARVSYSSSFLNSETICGIRNYVEILTEGFVMVPVSNYVVESDTVTGNPYLYYAQQRS